MQFSLPFHVAEQPYRVGQLAAGPRGVSERTRPWHRLPPIVEPIRVVDTTRPRNYALMVDCFSCRNNDQIDVLPPRERVAADPHWRVAHAFDTALPGWLVLLPRRHVTSIAELTDAEAATLGGWQVRLSRALRNVTGCVKTYVIQFAEQEGFSHVHFHVVPRMADLPVELRGPRVFGYLHPPHDRRVDEEHRDELATALRAELDQAAR
jgi:diadenosine tetraphosphate (Ap4A) HIT family hydrolase